MKVTADIQSEISHSVLCWLATCDADNQPNVSPKEIFVLSSEKRLLIADIASPKSVANIRENPKVCVSLIDIFRQRGFKLIGQAVIVAAQDDEFAELSQILQDKAGPDFPIRHVIDIAIEKITPIRAPSYKLFPQRREEERMADAYQTYGVSPR